MLGTTGNERAAPRRSLAAITVAVTLLAIAVRFYWLLRVQSPFAAITSDMAGYVNRADQLLGRVPVPDSRMLAFYPWGAHTLFALEFLVVGRESALGVAVVHALVGAIPVACTPLFVARLDRSRLTSAAAGVAVALWQPQVSSLGFFMSEMWFSAAIMLASLLAVAWIDGAPRRGRRVALAAFGTGCATAVAFVVRPQVLLTCALLGLFLLPRIARMPEDSGPRLSRILRVRDAIRRAKPRLLLPALFALPLAVAIVGSAARMQRLTGHVGLISENGPVMRLFADTDVGRIESSWVSDKGAPMSAWYSPGTKLPLLEANIERFRGFIGDPTILEQIRRRRVAGMSFDERIVRAARNVTLLVWRSRVNPEEAYQHLTPERHVLQRFFYRAALNVLPLMAIGLWLTRRKTAGLVLTAQLGTAVITAALYFAEARYRVPYDPFVVIAAVVACATLLTRLTGLAQRVGKSRPATTTA